MSLPKIAVITYDTKIPSTGKAFKYRPMLYKEEKILLTAKQSEDTADYFKALVAVCNACAMDGTTFDQSPIFDVEYVFTQIRSASISNVVTVSYTDNDDGKSRDFEIDLEKLTIKDLPDPSTKKSELPNMIDLGSDTHLLLRYPPVSLYMDKEFYTLAPTKAFDKTVIACLDQVIQGETITKFADHTLDEKQAWLDELPAVAYERIQKFLSTVPAMHYEIKYKNDSGADRTIVLSTIDDFFA